MYTCIRLRLTWMHSFYIISSFDAVYCADVLMCAIARLHAVVVNGSYHYPSCV